MAEKNPLDFLLQEQHLRMQKYLMIVQANMLKIVAIREFQDLVIDWGMQQWPENKSEDYALLLETFIKLDKQMHFLNCNWNDFRSSAARCSFLLRKK